MNTQQKPPERVRMHLTKKAQDDLEIVRDWMERASRGTIHTTTTTTDVVYMSIRLAAEYVTEHPDAEQPAALNPPLA